MQETNIFTILDILEAKNYKKFKSFESVRKQTFFFILDMYISNRLELNTNFNFKYHAWKSGVVNNQLNDWDKGYIWKKHKYTKTRIE